MAQSSLATELKRILNELQAKRRSLVDEISKIDQAFDELGLASGAAGATSKPSKAKATGGAKRGPKKGRGKRGSFSQSGEQDVIDFVKSKGSPTTAEINAHWTAQGRGGSANTTLTKLVAAKKLKRVNLKGQRGSQYKSA